MSVLKARIGVRDDEQKRTFTRQEITDDKCRYLKPASGCGMTVEKERTHPKNVIPHDS
jgi:hypothetical protein